MIKITLAVAALLLGAEALKTDRKFQRLVQTRSRQQEEMKEDGGKMGREADEVDHGCPTEEERQEVFGQCVAMAEEHGLSCPEESCISFFFGACMGYHHDEDPEKSAEKCYAFIFEGACPDGDDDEQGDQMLAAVKSHLKTMRRGGD